MRACFEVPGLQLQLIFWGTNSAHSHLLLYSQHPAHPWHVAGAQDIMLNKLILC